MLKIWGDAGDSFTKLLQNCQGIFYQNKALYNFWKRGQHSIVKHNILSWKWKGGSGIFRNGGYPKCGSCFWNWECFNSSTNYDYPRNITLATCYICTNVHTNIAMNIKSVGVLSHVQAKQQSTYLLSFHLSL